MKISDTQIWIFNFFQRPKVTRNFIFYTHSLQIPHKSYKWRCYKKTLLCMNHNISVSNLWTIWNGPKISIQSRIWDWTEKKWSILLETFWEIDKTMILSYSKLKFYTRLSQFFQIYEDSIDIGSVSSRW